MKILMSKIQAFSGESDAIDVVLVEDIAQENMDAVAMDIETDATTEEFADVDIVEEFAVVFAEDTATVIIAETAATFVAIKMTSNFINPFQEENQKLLLAL